MKRRGRLVMGKNCIRELLKGAPDRVIEVYTAQQSEKDPLLKELAKKGVPVRLVNKKELGKMAQSDSHQSFVAAVKEKGNPTLKGFLETERERSVVVMLDSIYDPQNLGAILRSCECFGADLVVWSRNRGCDLTSTAAKTSAGASEFVDTLKVSNLAETLKPFQEAGYWCVCADGGEGAESLYNFKFPEKTLLILGSEGEGVQPILKKRADFRVKIPMAGRIDSLNVSQAAAVFLAFLRN